MVHFVGVEVICFVLLVDILVVFRYFKVNDVVRVVARAGGVEVLREEVNVHSDVMHESEAAKA